MESGSGFILGVILTIGVILLFGKDVNYYYIMEDGTMGSSEKCNITNDISICEIDNKLITVKYFVENKDVEERDE